MEPYPLCIDTYICRLQKGYRNVKEAVEFTEASLEAKSKNYLQKQTESITGDQ